MFHSFLAAAAIHADLLQGERDRVIKEFKKGTFKVLVATDVASRGLDITSVKTVVNFEAARDIDSHVHRIGTVPPFLFC